MGSEQRVESGSVTQHPRRQLMRQAAVRVWETVEGRLQGTIERFAGARRSKDVERGGPRSETG